MRFVAIDASENSSILVTATKITLEADTLFGRFLGKKKIIHAFQYICPACQNAAEVAMLTTEPLSCEYCGRLLRLNRQARELQAK
jgi:hypothetical protein